MSRKRKGKKRGGRRRFQKNEEGEAISEINPGPEETTVKVADRKQDKNGITITNDQSKAECNKANGQSKATSSKSNSQSNVTSEDKGSSNGKTQSSTQTPLHVILLRREQYRVIGVDCMNRQSYDEAIKWFNNCLAEAEAYPLPSDDQTRQQLIACRLHGRNHEQNLRQCVEECDYLLEKRNSNKTVTTSELTPENQLTDPFQYHESKCDALLRLLDYKKCAQQLRIAVEEDQKEHLEAVHLFLVNAAKNTKLASPEQLAHNTFVYHLYPKTDLKNFYVNLTAPSRQNIFSLTWKQAHDSIDSQMCDSMLTRIKGVSREKIKHFLHKALDANIKSREPYNEIFLLKQEIAILISQKLWSAFDVPPKPPEGTEDIEKIFQNLPGDAPLTYLMENGVYMFRDGMEFVSAALVGGVTHLTSILECSPGQIPSLVVTLQYLTDIGFNVISEIAESGYVCCDDLGHSSELWTLTEEKWKQFLDCKIRAHEVLEVKAAENLVPPKEANEDPKVFEMKLEEIVGKEKQQTLMKFELKTSLPILKKYAKLMSDISGIEYETLVKELTEPDDYDEDEKLVTNDDEEPYQPVGLSVLIQNAEFDLKPFGKGDCYDKQEILRALRLLEKDVVKFQIDYKKKVFEVAGENKKKLVSVMANLQHKGLQLTKWLRGFVNYMMDRRDIEQQILDYSGCETSREAMKWFESLCKALSAGQAILLRLICRAMLWNLMQARMELGPQTVVSPSSEHIVDESTKSKTSEAIPNKQLTKDNGAPVVNESCDLSPKIPELDVSEPKHKMLITPETSRSLNGDTSDEGEELIGSGTVQPNTEEIDNKESPNKKVLNYLSSLPAFELKKGSGKKIEFTADCLRKTYKRILERRRLVGPALESFRTAEISQPNEKTTKIELKENVRKWILKWSSEENTKQVISELKENQGLSKLVIPYIEIAATMRQIQVCLQLPKQMYRTKAKISADAIQSLQKLSLLIDQSPREHVFYIVASEPDKQTTFVSPQKSAQSLHGATFTLCQGCSKMFGMLVCSLCGCAHYCGKQCQVSHWKRHSTICRGMQKYFREMQVFTL